MFVKRLKSCCLSLYIVNKTASGEDRVTGLRYPGEGGGTPI